MRILYSLAVISLIFFCSCTTKIVSESYDPEGSTDTRNKRISYQVKKTWRMDNGTLSVSNEFDGSRLNDFKKLESNVYAAIISPENAPINKSPWYAFSIWSAQPRKITIHLQYTDGYTHRYYPDISTDLTNWSPLDSSAFENDTVNNITKVELNVGPETLYLAGQEVMSSAFTYAYMDQLAESKNLSSKTIGFSTLGKPIRVLSAGNENSDQVIMIIGRQHPPEATGFLALQSFINRLLENDPMANEFRSSYQVVMIPMINPDGVDLGHWRHNASGIDLNRDWYSFNQPETSAIRDYLIPWAKENNKKIQFAIDFHSTQEDLFYVFERDRSTLLTGFTHEWLDGIEASLGDYEANRILTSGNSPVSTRWFYETFNTEAVTYEVGDSSPRARVAQLGETAAESLMNILNAAQ